MQNIVVSFSFSNLSISLFSLFYMIKLNMFMFWTVGENKLTTGPGGFVNDIYFHFLLTFYKLQLS